jgi:hypothetical protein
VPDGVDVLEDDEAALESEDDDEVDDDEPDPDSDEPPAEPDAPAPAGTVEDEPERLSVR